MQKLFSICPQEIPVSTRTKQQIDVYSKRHNCGVHTVHAPTVCVEFVFWLPRVWCVSCLEETWEERGYREERKEGGGGGRAQQAAGIF